MYAFYSHRVVKNFTKLSLTYFRCKSEVQQKIINSYYFMPGNIILSSSTVGGILNQAAERFGDDTAFISAHQGISKNYAEFRKEVDQLASGFVSSGLRKGDRIGIYSPNCYEWPLVQFASAKAGLILVNLNPALRPTELEFYLQLAGCKAVVSWDHLKTQNFFEIFCEIIPDLPQLNPSKLKSSNFPNLEKIIMISNQEKKGTLNLQNIIQSANKESDKLLTSIENSVQFDDPVNIQFTSGTTGRSKGATLSHHSIVNNALLSGRRLGYNLTKPVLCCQVPLFHCFGCVLGSLTSVIYHGTCVFPSAAYDSKANLKAIEQHSCTAVYGTPTMFVDLLHNYQPSAHNVNTLKRAVFGGAPATSPLIKETKEKLKLSSVHVAYGSTENGPVVALIGVHDSYENAYSETIQPLEYLELKVVDDSQRLLPINTEGELLVRGHGLFLGYWNDKKKTRDVCEENTFWYKTGDLCVMNENGFIKISGRKKDMILRGGENVYPLEIENYLNSHEAILESHIFGVPDKRMGEEICAWISVKEGTKLSEEEVKNYCKGKINHYKIPRYIIFVKEFPKTTSGKVKKFEMSNISIKKLNL